MNRNKLLYLSMILFVLSSIGIAKLDTYIKTENTPYGIVSFEFIQSIENSNSAMQAWGDIGNIAAGISLGFDYLYLIIYTSMTFIFLIITSEKVIKVNQPFGNFIRYAAYLSPFIGIFDAIENYGLIQLLLGSQNTIWPVTAYYCAIAKFSGLGLALLSLLTGQVYAKVKSE